MLLDYLSLEAPAQPVQQGTDSGDKLTRRQLQQLARHAMGRRALPGHLHYPPLRLPPAPAVAPPRAQLPLAALLAAGAIDEEEAAALLAAGATATVAA